MNVQEWIPRIFLAGALLGAIGCLGRSDYNLPVFLFAFIAWNYLANQKSVVTCLFAFSLIVDVIWFFVIGWGTWSSDAYAKLAPWEGGLHKVTKIVVAINFILKIASIGLSFAFDPNIKNSFTSALQMRRIT